MPLPTPATLPNSRPSLPDGTAGFVRRLAAAALALALFLALLLASAHLVATCPALYHEALVRAAAAEQATPPSGREPLTVSGLEAVLHQVLAYCDGASSGPQVMLPGPPDTQGAPVPALTDDELLHLVDVRWLFARGKAIRNAILVGLLAVLAIAARRAPAGFRWLTVAVTRGAAGWGLGLGLLVGAAGVLDFSAAFLIFHQMLFDNDLWLLPAGSLLITMLPEWLFARLATVIGVVAGVELLGLWWAAARSRSGSRRVVRQSRV